MKTRLFFIAMSLFCVANMGAQLKVNSNGNVGVGINPQEKLHVNGKVIVVNEIITHGGLEVERANSAHSNIKIGHQENNRIYVDESSNKYYGGGIWIRVHNDDVRHDYIDALMITEDGNIGIGDRTPSYKLDVNGDIATYGTVRLSSDKRLKKKIMSLNSSLAKLQQLEGVSYFKRKPLNTMRPQLADEEFEQLDSLDRELYPTPLLKGAVAEDQDATPGLGFIAQDLQDVFPELVAEDNDGYLTIDYIALIPVIVEAMKEQQAIIDAQSLKIKRLEGFSSNKAPWLGLKSANVSTDAKEESSGVAAKSTFLYQNVPNPFNARTEIKYFIPEEAQNAALYIFDLQGKMLKQNSIYEKGMGRLAINAFEFKAGMYIYTLIIDGQEVDSKRMILTE